MDILEAPVALHRMHKARRNLTFQAQQANITWIFKPSVSGSRYRTVGGWQAGEASSMAHHRYLRRSKGGSKRASRDQVVYLLLFTFVNFFGSPWSASVAAISGDPGGGDSEMEGRKSPKHTIHVSAMLANARASTDPNVCALRPRRGKLASSTGR